MDTPSPPQPTTTNPDPDHRIRPETTPKHLPPPFTNGVLKRLKPSHHTPIIITYKECLKNHAAAIGGHALDGCGEFMASPSSTPADPTSLKCAACNCHRNFHRRDHPPPPPPVHHVIEYQPHHRHHPPPPPLPAPPLAGAREHSMSPTDSPSPPPISSSYYPSAPHMLLALSSGVPAPAVENTVTGAGKKRFRTKFTQEQKERMHELAERIGWKMLKKDEDLIMGLCKEIGVDRGVFKVWMHNNKMTLGSKKDDQNEHAGNGSASGGGGIDFFMNRNNGSSSSS